MLTAEMKFLRQVNGPTMSDGAPDEDQTPSLNEKIQECRQKYMEHVQRMDYNRMPEVALNCGHRGRRNLGHPTKRQIDQ